ncbi:Rpn family recombination-promoting nuclease/putative transposase [Sodalis glossinidius]|uniref:Rpn family recombination-promoting nuclease/putative transposase n=1 Tax=Sodalis glossinidius TaxID=63612 RepID=UPI000680F6D8|nr:Rpn family recombination-promoting nuclease/putative transposase [Sodalis glossinidius]
MMQLLPQPISLFNFIAANINDARHFLDGFLPAPIRRCCDLTTLSLQASHIIDDALRGQFSDLLFSLSTVRGKGYIHCVQDLQSRPEKMMPLRMYRYSLTIMQRHIEQGNSKFPVVLPLLFYHGRTPANAYKYAFTRFLFASRSR